MDNKDQQMKLKLVTDTDGNVVFVDGNVFLFNEETNTQIVVEATNELLSSYRYQFTTNQETHQKESPSCPNTTAHSSDTTGQWKWRDDAVLQLIALWHSHEKLFQSTAIKNDEVWKIIASKLKEANPSWIYSWQQCRDKIKYIRKEYIKNKEWNNQSGNAPKTFKFYKQMDEILGSKPCVQPVAEASSHKKRSIACSNSSSMSPVDIKTESDDDEDSEGEERQQAHGSKSGKPKRKKKTKVEKEIEGWTNQLREDADKREKARAERFKVSLQIYQETMQMLIDKL